MTMPLSTSNSKQWGLTLLLFLLFFVSWEGFWRARGFRPEIDDSEAWKESRREASRQPGSVVIIGTSRALTDINLKVFEEMTGIHPIQLAISNTFGLRVLQHLADDSSFRGTVIYDLNEEEIAIPGFEGQAPQYIENYEHPFNIERRMKTLVQKSLVFPLPAISPSRVLSSIFKGGLPLPDTHRTIPSDRSLLMDYTKIDTRPLREEYEPELARMKATLYPSPEEFLKRAAQVEELINRIQSRGGKVILVRMPISGRLWDMYEEVLPKAKYWDALPMKKFHFKDYPALSKFECPDYSHLDYRDAISFTRSLVEIIRADLP